MVDDPDRQFVQIFANSQAALAHMRQTAEMAGCRIVSALRIDEEVDALDCAVPGAAILIELDAGAPAEIALPLLDWLQQEAECGVRRGLVSASFDHLDLVAASARHPDITLLSDADEGERMAAVTRVFAPVPQRVRGEGGTGARVLQRAPDYAPDPAGPDDLPFVRAIVRARRLRDGHFPEGLFADPAWDILLDLIAARLERKQVTVSSLCIAAAVPPTTALRWISVLTERGLLVRSRDSADRRRAYVELSDVTARALLSWLRRARRLAGEAL